MELVRYRPGEALRWLESGADATRRTAQTKGLVVMRREGGLGESARQAAGALLDLGRSAYADLMHQMAQASEYVLMVDRFDIVRGTSIRSVRYDAVRRVRMKGDRATLELGKGSVAVKPFAHLVAGRARVPIGWSRNGIEVPYELLVTELAARCGHDVDVE